jgi:hypothetical protein
MTGRLIFKVIALNAAGLVIIVINLKLLIICCAYGTISLEMQSNQKQNNQLSRGQVMHK